MITNIKYKLKLLNDIWNDYIFEYKYFSDKLEFNEYVNSNYVADIFCYFGDTLSLIFSSKCTSNFEEKFSYTISFLQAIFIQQDFIEELLGVFKIENTKKELWLDKLYSTNRGIRNELVGHPISKNNKKFESSVIFSSQIKENEIQYLLYHKRKQFNCEIKTLQIKDIKNRHIKFLVKYLDIIINKSKEYLREYLLNSNDIENGTKQSIEEILSNDKNMVKKIKKVNIPNVKITFVNYSKDKTTSVASKCNG